MVPFTQISPLFSCPTALLRYTPNPVRRSAMHAPQQVVALPAAAVVQDLVAAVLVAHRAEARGDLADRGVPVDLLVRAVITTAQRVEHTLTTTVLVVVEAQRLLAGVPLGRRVGRLHVRIRLEGVPIGSEPDLDATVALAQDAGGLVPRRRRRRRCPLEP